MKKLFFVLLFFFVQPALADASESQESLYNFFPGTYVVIGKELDSEKTYCGKVVFQSKSDHLVVTRYIKGEVIRGIGKIEKALGPDEARVLRVRFIIGGKEIEITYLWRSDLDNYPRLSGYLYQRGIHTTSPGMEALFIDH